MGQTEAQKRATAKWRKKNLASVVVQFYASNPDDVELLAKLRETGRMSATCKAALRAYFAANDAEHVAGDNGAL